MKVKEMFNKYSLNNQFFDELDISKCKRFGIFILSYLISIILFISPIIIAANFTMYSFYRNLIIIIIVLLIIATFSVAKIINHKLLLYFTQSEKRNLVVNHIVDTIVYLILCLIALLIINIILNRK